MKTTLKTSIRSIAVILSFLAISMTSIASTTPTYIGVGHFSIEKHAAPKTFKFEMTNQDAKTATVAIRDAYGNVLFKNSVKTKAHFAKVFNLAQLTDGEYFLTITNRAGTSAQPIWIDGSDIQIDKNEAISVFEPSIKKKGNLFTVLMPVLGEGLEISLNIYNDEGDVIYKEDILVEKGFAKNYNLDELEKGDYAFVLDAGFASFQKEVTVK